MQKFLDWRGGMISVEFDRNPVWLGDENEISAM